MAAALVEKFTRQRVSKTLDSLQQANTKQRSRLGVTEKGGGGGSLEERGLWVYHLVDVEYTDKALT